MPGRLVSGIRVRLDCLLHRCGYYRHYLAHGPAELSHYGYHRAERHCLDAQRADELWWHSHQLHCRDVRCGRPCYHESPHTRDCERWETAVRA